MIYRETKSIKVPRRLMIKIKFYRINNYTFINNWVKADRELPKLLFSELQRILNFIKKQRQNIKKLQILSYFWI